MATRKPAPKTFEATLERTGDRLHWVVIRVPFDVAKAWGRRGQNAIRPGRRTCRCSFPSRNMQPCTAVW